ncbi:coiled-coil domain-containing protein 171 [Polymixia lowei]
MKAQSLDPSARVMPTEPADRRRHRGRGRRQDSGQSRTDVRASHPRPAVPSKSSEEQIVRLKEIIMALQEREEQGGERGRSRGGIEEGEGREESKGLRWRVHQLEKDKLELTSLHNQEISRLHSQLARLRCDVERGEAQTQTLEYQLALTRREADRATVLSTHNNKLTLCVEELQQTVAELQRTLDINRQAREEDQHALQQEVLERDRLLQTASSENDRLTAQNQQLHTLLQEQEEVLKRRIVEVGREREKDGETIKRQTNEMKCMKEGEERSRRELELSEQKVKSLQSNIEAERAAHLESKFNSEIIQLRIRDLECVVSVERSGHQEALASLEQLRDQFRQVERDYTSATDTLNQLEKEYQQCKSDLSVALETERKTTSDLEEEKRQHTHTLSLLEQAAKRQSCIEDTYMTCMKQITQILQQHNTTPNTEETVSLSPGQQSQASIGVQLLKTTLNTYQHRLDKTTKEVQDLLCALGRLEQDNQTLRQLTSDQIKESDLLLSTLKEEVICLRQESSDWSTQKHSLKAELQTAQLEREEREREREREREEKERERVKEMEERTSEVERITDLYQKQSKEHMSFLYSLYQRLLAGCVLLDDSQSIMGNFSWAELCDVIREQADRLTSDLNKANDRIAQLERVCESRSICVLELQRSQECVLSRLEESVRQREEQHTHTLTQLHNDTQLYRSRCDSLQERASSLERERASLTSDLSELRGLLTHALGESSSLLSACSLLAGALTHSYWRARALSEQKTLLTARLAEREDLEGGVRRLAKALGEEEDRGESRGRRRWRTAVCVVLAVGRMCVLARASRVVLSLQAGGVHVCVCLCGEKRYDTLTTDREDDDGSDEGSGGVCVRWLRSKHLSSFLLSSMTDLQAALSHTGSSPTEVMSAARSSLSCLLEHLLSQSEGISSLAPFKEPYEGSKSTLASMLGQGLARLRPPQPGTKALVSTLQQHFLVFSQRLHSAEVERRGLRLEVAKLKRAAKGDRGQRHKDPCTLVPAERFDSVCVEMRQALNREEQAQTLLKEQSAKINTLNQEVRRKDQSLRILGKHLSGVQRERREVEERLRQAEEDLREASRRKDYLVRYMKAADNSYKEVRENLVQSRGSLSGQPLPLQLPRVHAELSGTERIMGGPEVTVCQNLLSTFSDLYQAFCSRIGWLEQEVSAHSSHVTALRSELQDACLRDNLAYVSVTEYSEASPLVESDASHPILLCDSLRDPPVSCNPTLSPTNPAPSNPLPRSLSPPPHASLPLSRPTHWKSKEQSC